MTCQKRNFMFLVNMVILHRLQLYFKHPSNVPGKVRTERVAEITVCRGAKL